MKHAFLIIAHNEYPILEVLLSMLDDERNDIYLHIDKRAVALYQKSKDSKQEKPVSISLKKHKSILERHQFSKSRISSIRNSFEKRNLCLLSPTVRNRPAYQEPRLYS